MPGAAPAPTISNITCGAVFGGIRGAAATSPIAAQVMLEVLENAATPITDRARRGTLREQGHLLGEQARLALAGPDLALIEERLAAFERFFAPDKSL